MSNIELMVKESFNANEVILNKISRDAKDKALVNILNTVNNFNVDTKNKITKDIIINAMPKVLEFENMGLSLNLSHYYIFPNNGKLLVTVSYKGLMKLLADKIFNIQVFFIHKDNLNQVKIINGTTDLEYQGNLFYSPKNISDPTFGGILVRWNTQHAKTSAKIITKEEIQSSFNKSPTKTSGYSPWNSFFREMCKAKAIKKALDGEAYLSYDMQRAIEIDNEMDAIGSKDIENTQIENKTINNLSTDKDIVEPEAVTMQKLKTNINSLLDNKGIAKDDKLSIVKFCTLDNINVDTLKGMYNNFENLFDKFNIVIATAENKDIINKLLAKYKDQQEFIDDNIDNIVKNLNI